MGKEVEKYWQPLKMTRVRVTRKRKGKRNRKEKKQIKKTLYIY